MPSQRPPASLRSMSVTVMAVLAGLVVAVCGALVLLTTVLHRTTDAASRSVESVRLAQEAEIDILLHARAADPIIKRELEHDLRGRLRDARQHVATAREARLLEEAEARIEEYFAAVHEAAASPAASARQQAAYDALEGLVASSLAQVRSAQAAAHRLNGLANGIGIGVGAVVLISLVVIVFWLTRRAFTPLLSLSQAMERFSRGDRNARAEERGAAELRDMSERFNQMASALAVQREAQMAFLGGVAHDLRNPLSVLQMAVQLLPPDQPLPDEARLRQTIAKLDRQIGRMQRMIGDFLDMAKIEAGELEMNLEAIDARDAVRHVVELFEEAARTGRLELALPAGSAPLRCDPGRIEQVLTNLVSNALKYSPAGTPVGVTLELGERDVVFSVTDRGIGIAEADQRRLFEPFRRLGRSRDAVSGMGLGLFVVKRIVEAHGGSIEVASEPGRGSTFRVRLPAAQRRRRTSAATTDDD